METIAVAVEELKEIDEINLSLCKANSDSSRPTNILPCELTQFQLKLTRTEQLSGDHANLVTDGEKSLPASPLGRRAYQEGSVSSAQPSLIYLPSGGGGEKMKLTYWTDSD